MKNVAAISDSDRSRSTVLLARFHGYDLVVVQCHRRLVQRPLHQSSYLGLPRLRDVAVVADARR